MGIWPVALAASSDRSISISIMLSKGEYQSRFGIAEGREMNRRTLHLLHAHFFVIFLKVVVVACAEGGDGDSGGGAWAVFDHCVWLLRIQEGVVV